MGKRRSRKKSKALAKTWCHKNASQVSVIYAGPITAVAAMVLIEDVKYYGQGGSRCSRLDVYDRDRGFTIAMGRAASAIADTLVELGETP